MRPRRNPLVFLFYLKTSNGQSAAKFRIGKGSTTIAKASRTASDWQFEMVNCVSKRYSLISWETMRDFRSAWRSEPSKDKWGKIPRCYG